MDDCLTCVPVFLPVLEASSNVFASTFSDPFVPSSQPPATHPFQGVQWLEDTLVRLPRVCPCHCLHERMTTLPISVELPSRRADLGPHAVLLLLSPMHRLKEHLKHLCVIELTMERKDGFGDCWD